MVPFNFTLYRRRNGTTGPILTAVLPLRPVQSRPAVTANTVPPTYRDKPCRKKKSTTKRKTINPVKKNTYQPPKAILYNQPPQKQNKNLTAEAKKKQPLGSNKTIPNTGKKIQPKSKKQNRLQRQKTHKTNQPPLTVKYRIRRCGLACA